MKAGPRTRRRLISAMAVVGGAIGISLAVDLPKRVIWNASASVPIGLYLVLPADDLRIGDVVVVHPPEPVARLAVARGYLGENLPMLKHVAGLPGAVVCRSGTVVTIGQVRVRARNFDSKGRPLPPWNGCRRVGSGELFLLNASVPDSLDGRYFGPIPRSAVVGRAVAIAESDWPR